MGCTLNTCTKTTSTPSGMLDDETLGYQQNGRVFKAAMSPDASKKSFTFPKSPIAKES